MGSRSSQVEKAQWINWQNLLKDQVFPELPGDITRLYLGHETCQHQLPSPSNLAQLLPFLRASGRQVTLVVPFLRETALLATQRVIEKIACSLPGLEVVAADWGILHWLCQEKLAEPILGRPLTAQHTDPRIHRVLESTNSHTRQRWVQHLDGTDCLIKKQPAPAQLASHYRRCWLDRPALIDFFLNIGIRRCEISHPLQGLELDTLPGWSYSLWTPGVLLAVLPQCPGQGEDFTNPLSCSDQSSCGQHGVAWHWFSFPCPIFRRANGLYYQHQKLPQNLHLLPINRIVTTFETENHPT